MPTYQYDCPNRHSFQKQAGREDSEIPCPRCGKTAQRAPFCRDGLPALIGETVAKGYTNASKAGDIKNKHGQYRVGLWDENMAEVKHSREKAGEEGHQREREEKRSGPNPFDMALRRAATENKQVG